MSYITLIHMMRNCSVHSMPLERKNNLQGRQESRGDMSRLWSISIIRWFALKVEEVKLTEGEKHCHANKD
jgi:hypothetical protein